MHRAGRLTLHYSALMVLSGLICAASNTLPFYFLSRSLEFHGNSNILWAGSSLCAVTSFLAFVSFQQLITARTVWWLLQRTFLRWIWVLLIVVLAMFFLTNGPETELARQLVYKWAIIALPLQLLCVALGRQIIYRLNNLNFNRRKAVFFGMGPQAHMLYLRLHRSPILGIEVIGYYAANPVTTKVMELGPVPPYLGAHANAWPRIQAGKLDMVFIQPYGYYDQELSTDMFEQLYDSTASIYMLPETRWSQSLVTLASNEIAGVPLLSIHDTSITGLARVLKRFMDLVLSSVAIVVLSPVMLACALAVKLTSRGPILFCQTRYGERGQPIPIYKFRSMYVDRGASLRQASRDDPRVTRVGRFLRRTSLDELPQLFNVLRGSMSLIGPRPHADAHNELYRRQISGYMLRHSIKPGITGWAQVNGLRGETDTLEKMERRIEYDRYYIQNWSLGLDIRILFLTVWTVIRGNNAY